MRARQFFASGLLLLVFSGPALAQQRPQCLHDDSETPADQVRREAAIELAHRINGAETRAREMEPSREYLPFDGLRGLPATPPGFEVQLHTDGETYSFSIKDTRDPCHYAVFSDQAGDVYEGMPSTPEPGFRLLDHE